MGMAALKLFHSKKGSTMEINIDERLETAHQNLATLQSRRETVAEEAARFEVLILKYKGAIEYLESLKAEFESPPKVEDDGHGKGEDIPSKEKSKVIK